MMCEVVVTTNYGIGDRMKSNTNSVRRKSGKRMQNVSGFADICSL